MKLATTMAFAAVAAVSLCRAADDPANTVWNAQKARAEKAMPTNAARVKALGAKGEVVWFAVPAMSDVMRLADTWPDDGRLGGTVRCVMAQDEWESCSFQLFSFADIDNVELKVEGVPLDADLRVVKLWFQCGNGWVSYFEDSGLKLVPELLLHDENLIRVELNGDAANYARVMKSGKETFVWISAPRGLDAGAFDPYDPGFVDAPQLLPVRLEKDAFKQFFLTFHAKKGQRPGVYRGKVLVERNGASLAEIPLAVRVLPFELPLPGAYRDPDQKFIFSCMGAQPNYERLLACFGGDEARAKMCFRAWMQSLYDHSLFYAPHVTAENAWCVPMLREIGYPLDPLFGESFAPWFGLNFGGRLSYEQLMAHKEAAEKCSAFYRDLVGHGNILVGHGDEQGAAFVATHREFFPFYIERGIRIGCAGHLPLLVKGGYCYGFYPMAGEPDDAYDKARPWHEIDPGLPVGFYASQHTGSENPQFTRRQHGLLGYLNGLTMVYNYAFETGSFNDRVNELYKPMAVAYANGDGLMETLAYAGFREACDDIRYATALKLICLEADSGKGSGIAAKMEARRALHYLAMLDPEKMDLNAVRLEMIERILRLREMLGK